MAADPLDDKAKMGSERDTSDAVRDTEKKDTKEDGQDEQEDEEVTKFPPEQEAKLLAEANGHKDEANGLFGRGQFDASLTAYEAALAVLPNYLDYDLAVLHANMAACHLKLQDWTEAMKSGTAALDALDKDERKEKREEKHDLGKAAAGKTENNKTTQDSTPQGQDDEDEEVEEEVISAGAAKAARPPAPPPSTAPSPPTLSPAEKRNRLRAKVLLRRARARSEQGGWANLSGAEGDYKALLDLAKEGKTQLAAADRRLAETQLRQLPPRTKAAQEAEMGEMWGKLKELGNGILRPFGMSTDNFQMVKDEKTGGYSMNFKQ